MIQQNNCLPCKAKWYIYKSDEIGIYHEQRLPIDKADRILSIYMRKQREDFIRSEVAKMVHLTNDERESILNQLLEKENI